MEYDYEKDVKINEFELEKEWLNQPNLYMKYAEACAQAEAEMLEAHEAIKVRRSELIQECKEDNPKATAPEIEAYYRTDDEHKELKTKWIEAQHNFRILEAAVKSLYMRKSALENLVRMSLSGYYGEPSSPEGHPEFTKEVRQKDAREKIKGNSRRTR